MHLDKQANDKERHDKNHTAIDIPSQKSSKSLDVDDLYNKEKHDLEKLDLEQIYELFDATPDGLNDTQVAERVQKFGPNKLEEKERNPILQFLLFMWNPLSWVMEVAAFVAIALSNGGGQPPDWEDFLGIVCLLVINSIIGFVEQQRAGNAVKVLMQSLAPESRVKRNGQWETIDASELVPGDVIGVKLGNVIPADARITSAQGEISVDQAALTGEALPVKKQIGDEIFSSTTCKQGEAEAIVIATGVHTNFGRATQLVAGAQDEMGSHLQRKLAKIGNFCICTILIFIVAEIIVQYAIYHYPYRRGIENILVLLIGGIPIAM
ncbi:unnamed protein product [Didymodactylos carnosus]|uniref:P-type Ca(2+) transporter n=1 Tax=Didymodactylos carnosus TaxID=1234261 RepID=A0A815ENQ5_9BILA|nr:unnamed protein product [Didymodactylos carnosus]CAF1308906.1 unnamed protein product [Didymodactylos carnosus]CAF3807624.1 unnamed protein product [Didymodactylos carnosus]CAF4144726.1 unnamed protein product [Didymodactylos carnosus]